MRNCKGGVEAAAAENKGSDIRMEMKKRGLYDGEELGNSSSLVQLKRRRREIVKAQNSTSSPDPENWDDSRASSSSSDIAPASCCSSNASSELSKEKFNITDLQEVTSSVEIATSAPYNIEQRKGRETTPSRALQAESEELEATIAPPSEANLSPRRATSVKMPSDAELEEFFYAAEKDIQKRFSKKYNFDIEKEEPLEGRYEWVKVKP